LSQGPVRRGLALLAAACPETPLETLARLSLGQRDACLLALREATFGPHLTSLAKCPGCGERLELNFDVADIRAAPPALLGAEVPEAETHLLNVAGYEVRFRLPNSLDLTEVAGGEAGRQALFERCLLAVRRNGRAARVRRLPAEVISAVAARMGQADPQAEVHLALSCPACGCNWQALFDIVSFFWSEINSWAYRILHEVHTLASAYGWREADILAMSQARRQLYLEMVSRG
jgi:hypothetical protein